MTRASDSVGESVRTGLHGLRERAVEAGKAGVEVVLDEGTKTSRRSRKKLGRARKELARSSKQARKEAAERLAELRKPGRKAKKAAIQAAKAAGESKRKAKKDFKHAKKDFKAALVEAKTAAKGGRRRRRWPWLLGLGVVAAGAAFTLRSKQEPTVASEPPRAATPTPATPAKHAAGNGQQEPSTTASKKKS